LFLADCVGAAADHHGQLDLPVKSPWARPVLRILAKGRIVRGTLFDIFGYTAMRRLERELRDSYRAMVLRLADELTGASYATAAAADIVRGYEDVKLAGIERYRARLAELGVS
jgi:indolepyruvate ferredoxin oxidoreductase